MRNAQPETLGGEPSSSYWDTRRLWDREVKEAIEDTSLNASVTKLQSDVASLRTDLTALQASVAALQTSFNALSALVHGTHVLRLGAAYGRVVAGTPTYGVIGEYLQAASGADDVMFALPVVDGDRILEVSSWGEVAVATAWSMAFYSFDPLAGGFTNIGGSVNSSTTAGKSKVTLSSLTTTVTSPSWYAIRWFSGAVNNRVRAVECKYDHP